MKDYPIERFEVIGYMRDDDGAVKIVIDWYSPVADHHSQTHHEWVFNSIEDFAKAVKIFNTHVKVLSEIRTAQTNKLN